MAISRNRFGPTNPQQDTADRGWNCTKRRWCFTECLGLFVADGANGRRFRRVANERKGAVTDGCQAPLFLGLGADKVRCCNTTAGSNRHRGRRVEKHRFGVSVAPFASGGVGQRPAFSGHTFRNEPSTVNLFTSGNKFVSGLLNNNKVDVYGYETSVLYGKTWSTKHIGGLAGHSTTLKVGVQIMLDRVASRKRQKVIQMALASYRAKRINGLLGRKDCGGGSKVMPWFDPQLRWDPSRQDAKCRRVLTEDDGVASFAFTVRSTSLELFTSPRVYADLVTGTIRYSYSTVRRDHLDMGQCRLSWCFTIAHTQPPPPPRFPYERLESYHFFYNALRAVPLTVMFPDVFEERPETGGLFETGRGRSQCSTAAMTTVGRVINNALSAYALALRRLCAIYSPVLHPTGEMHKPRLMMVFASTAGKPPRTHLTFASRITGVITR
ncbi:hypothetical protein AAG570_000922 [Ranatra chinensis]|uniref:Uncharacterized protein n=1 Tax=Ranatra chinensis TaxID=642074 RepID=A0ABD0YYH4_9HEMI